MFCEKMTQNIEIKRCFAEVVWLLLEHPSLPVPQVAIQITLMFRMIFCKVKVTTRLSFLDLYCDLSQSQPIVKGSTSE